MDTVAGMIFLLPTMAEHPRSPTPATVYPFPAPTNLIVGPYEHRRSPNDCHPAPSLSDSDSFSLLKWRSLLSLSLGLSSEIHGSWKAWRLSRQQLHGWAVGSSRRSLSWRRDERGASAKAGRFAEERCGGIPVVGSFHIGEAREERR